MFDACLRHKAKTNNLFSGSHKDINIPVELELAAEEQESTSASVTQERNNGVLEKNYVPSSGSKPQISHSNVNTEAKSSKTGKTEMTSERKTASVSEFTPETWMIPETLDGELSQLNLAIVSIWYSVIMHTQNDIHSQIYYFLCTQVGHVDSGKSTLSGRLLHLSGRISQKEMHKYEKEAKQQVLALPSLYSSLLYIGFMDL